MTATTSRKWKIIKIAALVFICLPFVWFAFVAIFFSIAGSRNWSEIVSDHSKLPKELQAIVDDGSPTAAVYHELRNRFDLSMTRRGVNRIDGSESVARFIEIAKLEVVDGSHPKREEYEKSLKLLDSYRTFDGDLWFASPGFGTIHQEIVDLYLLRTTEDKRTAIIYHYWTF